MISGKKTNFEEELERKGSIVYTNVGDSMLPLLRQGRDLLVIERPSAWKENAGDTANRLKRLDVPLYKRDNGAYVLHRIIRVRKNDYVLCGDNRYHREYGITDRHIIGVLKAVVRDGKEISVEDKKYRIYAHVWCDFFLLRAVVLRGKRLVQKLCKMIQSRAEG